MQSSQSRLTEALGLVEEALRALELNELPLPNVAMRAGRVARLLEDVDFSQIFSFEVGGYPASSDRMSPEMWRLTELANRHYTEGAPDTPPETLAYLDSIEALETGLTIARDRLEVVNASPHDQSDWSIGFERAALASEVDRFLRRVAARRGLLHGYLSATYFQLKYSQITADAFERVRTRVDSVMRQRIPSAVQQFDSAYANLESANPEDWANAVHSCRRILEGLADALFPPADDRMKNGVTIKLGPKHYKNRLACYAEDRSSSASFDAVVGTSLTFLVDRLDAVFGAANKGTHAAISRTEADRYVIYTYMVLGDLLSL